MTKTSASELVALRGKWQKERKRLYDPDTGLPTVAALMEDLVGQLRERGSLSILSFSPGSEGRVEEVWGWKAYDDLLVDFVRRLKSFQADGIIPAGVFCLPHVSSDEVLLMIDPEAAARDRIPALEQKAGELDLFIRGYLAERADLPGRFRSFVGASRVHADPRRRPERLVYSAVRDARDRVTRQTIRAEIRGAAILQEIINRRDITPLFQPVIDLSTGEMIGMEALSRGPKGSDLESGETLFSLAERTELLGPLERVCRDVSLQAAAANLNGRKLFMNLSPAAASDPEFLGPRFRDSLASFGIAPSSIVLEITERTYVVYESLFRDVLSRFREQNFGIAVDDVGTGYSSLASLADIQPDYLKFDHVFVRDLDRRQIKQDLLEALMSFARKMNTRVIAEGIETREELEALRALGVEYGQGFLFAPGVSIDEISRYYRVAV
ncbi:MAG TPA: EAL domain-containing protein [Thermoanaerobaculia bacterium]|jgi:EAL domain-containing protein (putative c-di-GMP-specific phosphodiesterase class I)|nr:EAL domain-containing protein [Thermoanaerobaculia bacterium]